MQLAKVFVNIPTMTSGGSLLRCWKLTAKLTIRKMARKTRKYSLAYDIIKLTHNILGMTTKNMAGKTKNHVVFHEASLTDLSLVAIISKISEAPSVKDRRLVHMVKI